MIVGQQKPFEEIWEMVKGFKKILVFGCNTCVAICHAGGAKEAELPASMIRMKAAQEGVEMQGDFTSVMRHCEPEYVDPVMEEVRAYDLVLSTACGVGVNFLSERIGKVPVYPGINTTFFGAVPEPGVFVELCAGCGNCVLHMTGGICPGASCSKSPIKRVLAKILRRCEDELRSLPVRILKEAGEGVPEIEIAKKADETDVDLIVLGARGVKGISSLFLGA